MKKTSLIWGSLILFLFLFPVFVSMTAEGQTAKSPKLVKETSYMVYAANVLEEESAAQTTGKALLYFTHSHEAYEPMTKAFDGKIAVSHHSENIMKIGEKLKSQLDVNGVETTILPINIQAQMEKKGIAYGRSYKEIRPYVQKQVKADNYDFIIDLHRDHLRADRTTIVHNGEKYAKVAFVIGKNNPNYKQNQAKAKLLKDEMEKLVPGITRDFIVKSGVGVDGKYNQDLHPSLLLIELGGIGNAEDELNRTVSVIGSAAAAVLQNS